MFFFFFCSTRDGLEYFRSLPCEGNITTRKVPVVAAVVAWRPFNYRLALCHSMSLVPVNLFKLLPASTFFSTSFSPEISIFLPQNEQFSLIPATKYATVIRSKVFY